MTSGGGPRMQVGGGMMEGSGAFFGGPLHEDGLDGQPSPPTVKEKKST